MESASPLWRRLVPRTITLQPTECKDSNYQEAEWLVVTVQNAYVPESADTA
jgi:hypothetical protein